MGYPTFYNSAGKAESLEEMLVKVDDLDWAIRCVAREQTIRHAMAETGETREVVETMLDASISMDQEGVLDLMDGEPTTLRAGLQRYVGELEKRGATPTTWAEIGGELDSLLAYPWPGQDGRQ